LRRGCSRQYKNEVLVEDSTVDVESGGPGAIHGGVGPAGTRTFTTTYLVSGVVDSTTETLSQPGSGSISD
jgi:ABC-type lipopolysaccharide export system ATPase subunit